MKKKETKLVTADGRGCTRMGDKGQVQIKVSGSRFQVSGPENKRIGVASRLKGCLSHLGL
jgi:hypothetical protein